MVFERYSSHRSHWAGCICRQADTQGPCLANNSRANIVKIIPQNAIKVLNAKFGLPEQNSVFEYNVCILCSRLFCLWVVLLFSCLLSGRLLFERFPFGYLLFGHFPFKRLLSLAIRTLSIRTPLLSIQTPSWRFLVASRMSHGRIFSLIHCINLFIRIGCWAELVADY